MSSFAVSVLGLEKSYGGQAAVSDVSFDVAEGEIFGLLGPNGAGKTTTLECIEGLRRPDRGRLSVHGVDPQASPERLRGVVGVQLQSFGLPGNMRVGEALAFFASYHGVPPRVDLLRRFGLDERPKAQYQHLSTGQQRRLALALAVAHDPPVLFLDEPTAGLDVATRADLHQMVLELRAAGKTVILTTHDMAEAEKLCDRVAVLLRGKIVAAGAPRELTADGGGTTKVSVRTSGNSLDTLDLPGVAGFTKEGEYLMFLTSTPGPSVAALISHIETHGDSLVDLRVERPSLEERFLELTNPGEAGR